jgi:subtilisin-like proprotein convertase family protein
VPISAGHACDSLALSLLALTLLVLALGAFSPAARGQGTVTLEARPAGSGWAPAPGAAGVAALDCAPEPPGTEACLVLRCDPCNLSIPDQGFRSASLDLLPGQLEALTGSTNCTILDVNAAVELEHSLVGDVAVDLIRPGAANSTLYSPALGCDATAVDAVFDDEAGNAADACPAAGGVGHRPNTPLALFDGLSAAGDYQLRVRDRLFGETGSLSRWGYALAVFCSAGPPPPSCTPTPTQLCLSGGRFEVRVAFTDPLGIEGQGQGVQLTGDTGYFWFFSASNVELVIKVLDACSFSNRFWVFAGGLTNVKVEITVRDTLTNTVKRYTNPPRTPFQPIQDTDAFATCS